ncbi:diguanylate cyclase [Legionella sp. 9fVS26]|nr:diguanylate cyclase [Legionella sp. 9fVS26]
MSIKTVYQTIITNVVIFFLILSTILIYANYIQNQILKSESNRYNSINTAQELLQSSDDLTKMARLYTVTGDEKYKRYFNDILAIREGRLSRPNDYSQFYWHYVVGGKIIHNPNGEISSFSSRVKQLNFSQFEMAMLKKAEQNSINLTALEKRAFGLTKGLYPDKEGRYTIQGKKDLELARQLLHGKEYHREKVAIMQAIEEFKLAVERRTAKKFTDLETKQQYLLYIFQFFILFGILLCLFGWRYANRRVMQPIAELVKQTEKIDHGDYSARNHVAVKNELETLGKILNKMSGSIQKDISKRAHLTKLLQASEEQFRSAIEFAPIGMTIKSLDGHWIQVNQALCEMLGYSREEILSLGPKQITHPDDVVKEEELEKKLASGTYKNYQCESRYIHKSGKIVWVSLSAALVYDAEGNPLNLISQVYDIGPRRSNEIAMTNLHEKMSATLVELQQREHENELLYKMNEMLQTCKNADEGHSIIQLTVKALFPSLSGGLAIYNKSSHKLQTVRQWGKHQLLKLSFTPDDCWALRNGNIYTVDDPQNAIICEHYISPPKGAYINLPFIVRAEIIGMLDLNCASGETITDKDKKLAITLSESIKLALANINLREALSYQALRDGLTGLFNRRYLDETLPQKLEEIKRNKSILSIAMVDIDFFKNFNDKFGHDAGDTVLKFLAKILQQSIRSEDIVCRFGGEEFVVILMDSNISEAQRLMETICQQVKKIHLNFQGIRLPKITLSVGIAQAPMHGSEVEKLLGASDEALYIAKNSGRDKVKIFHKDD